MGDAFYNNNGTLKRVELVYGDGAVGKKVTPLFKNPSGDTIEIPQLRNMLLNLCAYSFYLNNRKSCSQYMDGSDLFIGKCAINSGQRHIPSTTFGDNLAPNSTTATGLTITDYIVNTRKGCYHIAGNQSQNIGFYLPNNAEVLTNSGDSFTLSITFAFNNITANWLNLFGFVQDNANIQNDGMLRVEKYNGDNIDICYNPTAGGGSSGINLISTGATDKIHNLIMRVTRQAGTNNDELIVDSWFNGSRKSTAHNIGVYRGGPKKLMYFNSGRDNTTTGGNFLIFSCRVWNTSLSNSEIDMLQKIEARNIGRETLDTAGTGLFGYLSS